MNYCLIVISISIAVMLWFISQCELCDVIPCNGPASRRYARRAEFYLQFLLAMNILSKWKLYCVIQHSECLSGLLQCPKRSDEKVIRSFLALGVNRVAFALTCSQ